MVFATSDADGRNKYYRRYTRSDSEEFGQGFTTFYELSAGGQLMRSVQVPDALLHSAKRVDYTKPGSPGPPTVGGLDDSYRITSYEFLVAWKSGVINEPSFRRLKWMILFMAGEVNHLREVVWQVDAWYPLRSLGERLTMADRAVRELLDRGLVSLRFQEDNGDLSPVDIPRSEWDDVLSRTSSWDLAPGESPVSILTTQSGSDLLDSISPQVREVI